MRLSPSFPFPSTAEVKQELEVLSLLWRAPPCSGRVRLGLSGPGYFPPPLSAPRFPFGVWRQGSLDREQQGGRPLPIPGVLLLGEGADCEGLVPLTIRNWIFPLWRTFPLASRRPTRYGLWHSQPPFPLASKRRGTLFFHLSCLEGEWDDQCQTFSSLNFWWMSSFHSLVSKTWYGFGPHHGKMWLLRFGKRHKALCELGGTENRGYKMLILIAYWCLANCL